MPFPPKTAPIPPPPPVAPPPPPAPPPAPPTLTVAEKLRHVGWALGAWAGAGTVGYAGLQAFAQGWLGAWEFTGVTGFAGLVGLSGVWALVPLYTEWSNVRAHRQYTDVAAVNAERMQRLHEYAYTQYIKTVLGGAEPPPDPPIRMTVMGKVVGEDSGATTARAPAATRDVNSFVEDQMARVRSVMDQVLGIESDEEADPPAEDDRPTTVLPPLFDALPPGPPSRYTADMRFLVASLAAGRSVSKAQIVDKGHMSRPRWERACKALDAAGVLAQDPSSKGWTLGGYYYWIAQDTGLQGLHDVITRKLDGGQ